MRQAINEQPRPIGHEAKRPRPGVSYRVQVYEGAKPNQLPLESWRDHPTEGCARFDAVKTEAVRQVNDNTRLNRRYGSGEAIQFWGFVAQDDDPTHGNGQPMIVHTYQFTMGPKKS